MKARWSEGFNSFLSIALIVTFSSLFVGCSSGEGGSNGEDKAEQTGENGDDTPKDVPSFTIKTQSSSGGIISPTSIELTESGSTNFTLTPDTGYELESVTGCGGSLSANTYSVSNISADCKVEVAFALKLVAPAQLRAEQESFDSIKVSWNPVNGASSYNLYYAEDSFGSVEVANYASVENAVLLSRIIDNKAIIQGVGPGKIYHIVVTSTRENGVESDASSEVSLAITKRLSKPTKLNDTGIILCATVDNTSNDAYCFGAVVNAKGSQVPLGQDGHYGTSKDGSREMTFTKVTGYEGKCVRDENTGLIWEVKQSTEGLHYKDNTYTWYDPDKTILNGLAGKRNGGVCSESNCDTYSFVKVVNEKSLCGFKDWRLPTQQELRSVNDYGRFNPSINTDYFPNTSSNWYWSSNLLVSKSDYAWSFNFRRGSDLVNQKSKPGLVRLVR